MIYRNAFKKLIIFKQENGRYNNIQKKNKQNMNKISKNNLTENVYFLSKNKSILSLIIPKIATLSESCWSISIDTSKEL